MPSRRTPGAPAARPRPHEVPYIGWSCAAHEFRVKAADLAPAGDVLPLFIGDPGVGRRCMASVWRHVAGLSADVPTIDLDTWVGELPRRCLGYTARRPERGRHCFLLGRGCRGNAPGGRPGETPLPARLLQHFGVTLYVPPIHGEREIDILAHLDYSNRIRFPRAGFRYRAVHAPLICRMVFDSDWPANFGELTHYLDLVAARDRGEAGSREAGAGEGGESRTTEVVLPVLREREEIPWFTRRVNWRCDAEEVPLDALPDLAVRIYAWHCGLGPPEGDGDREVASDPRLTLLPESLWEAENGLTVRDVEVASDLRLTLLPESLWEAENGLTVRDVLAISPEVFVRERLLLGLEVNSPKWALHVLSLIGRVRNHPVFGATLESLQAGLTVDVPGAAVALKPWRPHEPVFNQVAEVRSGAWSPDLDKAKRLDPLMTQARFSFDGEHFFIIFSSGKDSEQGQYPIKNHVGLYYYYYLISNPGLWLDAGTLRDAAKRRVRPDGFRASTESDSLASGAGIVRKPTRQPVMDDATCRAVDKRLRAIEERLKEADPFLDGDEIEDLKAEASKLEKHKRDAGYRGKMKDLDDTVRRAIESVRKAMNDAKGRIGKHVPGFAEHLGEFVESNRGNWRYRPPATFYFDTHPGDPARDGD